jgi:hypothetical protein
LRGGRVSGEGGTHGSRLLPLPGLPPLQRRTDLAVGRLPRSERVELTRGEPTVGAGCSGRVTWRRSPPARRRGGASCSVGTLRANSGSYSFTRVRRREILRTSHLRSSKKFVTISHIQAPAKITHLSDTSTPLTGVCCRPYVGPGPRRCRGRETEIRL